MPHHRAFTLKQQQGRAVSVLLQCMMEEAFHRQSSEWLATLTQARPFACSPVLLTIRPLLTVMSMRLANNVAAAVGLGEVEMGLEMEMETSATETLFAHSRTAS